MADNRFKVMAVGTFKESAVDCPVQLKKYQIIYDVVADKTYLRAVLESFSDKKIVRVFLNIDCADIFEQKFADIEKAAVNVECDKKYSEFGKECPIIIPKGTKTVKAYISRVVFSDMTVWENRDLTFVAPVSDLKPYTAIKEKNQLEKELAKRNYVAKYLPVRYEKSWRCTCGHLNGNLNDVCSACRSRASILFNIFDDKNLEICKKEDTYNEARKFDTSKDYLQASKLYSTILDYKDSKVLFAKALENSKEAIYNSALDTLKTAQKEENFDSAIKSLSSISEYKDAKTQIEKAKEQKNEFIYNQALQRVKKDDVGKNDFDKSISDMQRIPSYKDSSEKIREIDSQKQAFLDKKEHARKMKKVRNISIVACVIAAIVIAILIPYFVEPNLYTKETTYEEITIGNQSGYCLERYNENEEKVVIPSEYLGKPVLKIGERAFQGKSIKEITIPESVSQIGYDAFAKCKNLNAVYYTDIEKWCQISFGNSNANPLNYAHNLYLNGELLTDLTISDSVAVDQYTFVGCSALQNITADSVIASTIARSCQSPSFNVVITHAYGGKIDRDAFNGCKGLKNITLPADVKSIGYEAFRNCNSLENIYFNGDVAKWCVISGLDELMSSTRTLYIGGQKVEGDLVIPDGVKSISNTAFAYCNGLTSVTVSASVAYVWNNAFLGCSNLTSITAFANNASAIAKQIISKRFSVTITGGTNIADQAFEDCSGLVGITISNDVKSIGAAAFHNCTGLTSIVIPDGVTSIESDAFFGCSNLANVTLSNTLTNIAPYAFKDCSSLTSIAIPDGVQTIGNYTFFGCTDLANVTIGNNVTNIGDYAFSNCSSLTSITIPDGVTSIGERTFENCASMTSVEISNSVTEIGEYAFYGCSALTSFKIPNSVTSIEDYAFCGCSGLTDITIPDSVTSIGEFVFYGCNNLASMTLPFVGASKTASNGYDQVFGYIFGYETTFYSSDSVSGAISQYYGNSKDYYYYIPSGIKSVTITGGEIPYHAFYNCSGLTSITIPDGVTSIGGAAFYNCCGLTNITIPDSVTSIGGSAFSGCSGLTSITIPDSVTSIGSVAFYGCVGLTRITGSSNSTSVIAKICHASMFEVIITSGTSIDANGFSYCSGLTSVIIGNSVTSIGGCAFYCCGRLTSVTIPDSVTSIGWSAFQDCKELTSITIPDSVTSIGNDAFSNCSKLQDIYITDIAAWCNISGLSNLMKYASSNKKLYINNELATSIRIPNGVKTIPSYAFYGCSSLTSVTIGNGVTSIGNSAFERCSGLTSVIIPNSVTSIGSGAFYNTAWYNNQPDGLVYAGKVAYNYKGTMPSNTSIAIKEGTISISSYAFSYCSGLIGVTISDSVTSIGSSAFSGCSSLESITIPFVGAKAGVTSSDTYQYPFGYIFGTSSYTGGVATMQNYYGSSTSSTTSSTYYIPSSLKSVTVTGGNILYGAFYNCRGLTSVTIPDSVTSIGEQAFYNCRGLTSITIPDSVTSIGDSAFSSCNALTRIIGSSYATSVIAKQCGASTFEVIITSGTSIGEYAFNNCSALTITIGNGVTSIGNYAFHNCSSLTSVSISDSVTSIGSCVFEYCSGLKTVFYAGTEEQWKAISIGSYNSSLTSATIVYNYDGAELTYSFVTNCEQSIDPITAKYLASLPTPTKDGFYFGGWYDNETFEGEAVSATYYSKDKTTLYAKWLTEEEWNTLHDGTSFEKAYVAERGQTYVVSITEGRQVHFVFTATTSGSFIIQSTGNEDTYGALYSSNKWHLTYNDDSGSEYNFKITYTMIAGTTYYIAVGLSYATRGTFMVHFS